MADLKVKIGDLSFRNPVLPAAGPNVMKLSRCSTPSRRVSEG